MNETNPNDNQNSTDRNPAGNENRSEEQNEEKRFPLWVSLLALFGILIVVVIAAIGIVRIAGNAEGNLSRLGSGIADIFRGSERIQLDVENPTVTSGEQVAIELNHRNRSAEEGEGTYSVVVECGEGVTAQVNGEDVACDEETALEGTPEEVSVGLTSEAEDRFTDVPVTVAFRGEDTEITSEIILTVLNEDVEADDETDDEETPDEDETDDDQNGDQVTDEQPDTGAPQPTPAPQGNPDLAVSVLALGRMDGNEFVADDNIDEDDRAAVRFLVINAGTAATGPWTYNAILPLSDAEIYHAETQESLLPGDRIEFTLGFDNIEEEDGRARLYLSVDPLNRIDEITELNNYARVEFEF